MSFVFVLEPNRHRIRNMSTDKCAILPQKSIEHLMHIRQAIKERNERNPRSMDHYLEAYQDVLFVYYRQYVV